MTKTLVKDISSVRAPTRGAMIPKPKAKFSACDDVVSLCIELRSLQTERLMLKCARDNLESVAALTSSKEEDFQQRFDELTDQAVDLAERAATQKARTLAELSAKAAFVLELSEPNDDGPLEKLLWGLAVDIIAYSAEHSLEGRKTGGASQD